MEVESFQSQNELEQYLAKQKQVLINALKDIGSLTQRIVELEKKLNEKEKTTGLGWFKKEQ